MVAPVHYEEEVTVNRSYLKIAVVVGLLALVGFVQPAAACMGPPPTPPTVWVIFQSPTTVWIVFHNYITFGANPGQFCACGLNQVGPITGFQTAQIVDPSTNKPIPGWNFSPNDTVGKEFGTAAPTIGTLKLTRSGQVVPSVSQAPFGGFLSPISQSVKAGITADLWICVTVVRGTTFGQLAQALSSQGQIGTSAANSDGTLVAGHTNIVRPGTIMQMTSSSTSAPALPDFVFEEK
jgi:hypothetical protein